MIYTFDTETSNDGHTAWIWSWALCDEDLHVEMGDGTNVLSPLLKLAHGSEVWVHNLDYDGEFLFYELLRSGYALVYDVPDMDRHHGIFEMLDDGNGILSISIYTEGRKVTLRDSNRIFRCKLAKLPKVCGFGDLDQKEELDYDRIRPRDYTKTPKEESYQMHDVTILMRAIKWVKSYCAGGNTVGSIALNEFKRSVGKTPFTPLHPDERTALRSLYSGGIVTISEKSERSQILTCHGRVYDRNSMYPSEAVLPLPVAIDGRYAGAARGGSCAAYHVQAEGLRLKPNGFGLLITPFTGTARSFIPLLDKWIFREEWEAIREEYEIKRFEIIETIFFAVEEFAGDFVRKWYEVKSTEPDRREYAKMVLNNVTGKWAENPLHEQQRRHLVGPTGAYMTYTHRKIDDAPNKWQFMPATARITSNSRLRLREAAILSGRENLLYTDTDSVHTTGTLPPKMIDHTRLGAWDLETEFDYACYIKPKSYWEALGSGKSVCRHAGINDDATLALYDAERDTWVDTGDLIGPLNMRAGNYFWTRRHKKIEGGVMIERRPKIL